MWLLRFDHLLLGNPVTGSGENSSHLHLRIGFLCNLQTRRNSSRSLGRLSATKRCRGKSSRGLGTLSEPKRRSPPVGDGVSRAPRGGARPVGLDSLESIRAARVAEGAQRPGRELADHAERSVRPARVSAARDTRVAVRGRPEVSARVQLAAVHR